MLLAVRTSSYGCTWEVWRALKKLELLSSAPRATLTLLSCSAILPRASITRHTLAKHEPILKYHYQIELISLAKRKLTLLKEWASIIGLRRMLRFTDDIRQRYLTIRSVALEGEGSNCFSITQLVGQKRQ